MNNTQKILLIIGILIFIIILDLFINNSIDDLVNDTLSQLQNVKEFLQKEDFEKSQNETKKVNEKWFKYENKLAFFIEHDELEKISLKVAIITENCTNKEYKSALEDVIETTYLLEHVKDKLKLKWKNIF